MGFQHVILHDGFLHHARKNRPLELIDDYLPWLRQHLGYKADYFDHGVNCNSFVARPWDKPEYLHPTNYIVTQGIDFLRRRDPRKPFFLYLSFHRPHPPYDPPQWAFEQYLQRDMPEVPLGDWRELWKDYAEPHRPDCLVGDVEPHILHRARAGYYGHITHIDHQINRFLETLTEYGVSRNTYVCFTSDHGEMLGDHNLFRKGTPYNGSARIPLLVKGPQESGIIPNAAYDQVVELRDVMPTLLDCAGLPIPEQVEGKSLLPILQGQAVEWRPFLHGEHLAFGQSLQWMTDGCEKYIWCSGSGREQLFHLADDPQELHDLAHLPESAERLAFWRKQLVQVLSGREEGFTDGTRLLTGRPVRPCLSRIVQDDDKE